MDGTGHCWHGGKRVLGQYRGGISVIQVRSFAMKDEIAIQPAVLYKRVFLYPASSFTFRTPQVQVRTSKICPETILVKRAQSSFWMTHPVIAKGAG